MNAAGLGAWPTGIARAGKGILVEDLKKQKNRESANHSNILSQREEAAVVAGIESSTPPESNDNQERPHAWRIALYSHDTMGLGHVRRNILIARMLGASSLRPVILMVTGVGEAAVFGVPPAAPVSDYQPEGEDNPRGIGRV